MRYENRKRIALFLFRVADVFYRIANTIWKRGERITRSYHGMESAEGGSDIVRDAVRMS